MCHLSLPQGRHASVDEITACALNAIELDKKHGDEAVQVRVTMGKEPTHFLAIFKGKLVIYEVTWVVHVGNGRCKDHCNGNSPEKWADIQERSLPGLHGLADGSGGTFLLLPKSSEHHMCEPSPGLTWTQLPTPELQR